MKTKTNTIKRVLPYLRPYKVAIIMVMLLAIPMSGIRLSVAGGVQYILDTVLIAKDKEALFWMPIGIAILCIINFFVRFLHFYLMRATATRAIQHLRNDFYQHLMRLSLSFFNRSQGGELLSRTVYDVNQITIGISSINQFIREPLNFLGVAIYMFYLNWQLSILILFVIGPIVAIVLGNTGKHTKRYSHQIQASLAELTSILSETFTGMRVIKGFSLESFMKGQFMVRNRELSRRIVKAIRVEELARPGMELIGGLALAGILFLGGQAVISGKMTAGEVAGFITSLFIMINSIRAFGDMNLKYNQLIASTDRVFSIFDERPDIVDTAEATTMPNFAKTIEFRNVSFYYEEGSPILENFSLTIRKGEVVALVGPSGAGKSTLLGLLPRFYDPQQGSILVDGIDIRKYKLSSLRSKISIVTQEVFLFHDSIRNNIRAGMYNSSEEDIIDAAESAQAWKFIKDLPEKLNTIVGDRGQKLSGGERQRVSIARALLRDTPILLLDEATSALDSKNEQLVQAALDNLLKGRTSIVVAHRLSTIRKADRIVVIDNGKIVEMGSHNDLLAQNGAYAQALSLQEGF